MSGIVVVYDPLERKDEITAVVQSMCQALQRSDQEGPVEWYADSNFGMGRCRPALVNQTVQPAWNEDHTVCALFHGELFGCDDLTRSIANKGHHFSNASHAEFVVHLYEDKGDAFIHKLNGNFALALWDSHQRKLLIANDRYGLCPLYTALSDGKYLWASAPKGILADTTFPRRVNPAAMADFLCLGFLQGNDTMLEGIEELPPASMVIFQDDQVHRRQYWDLSFQEEETGVAPADYLDELLFLLKRAAIRRQGNEPTLGLLLTGGLDSRVILAIMDRDTTKAFTFGTRFCDDIRLARQLAKAVNVPHSALEIQPDYLKTFAWIGLSRTEDLINCDQFHGISVYDEIVSHVNALMTGSAGEDIFGEFPRDPHGEFWGDAKSVVDRYYDTLSAMTDEELELLMKPPYYQQMKGLARSRFRTEFGKYPSRHVGHKENYWSIKQLQRRRSNRLSSLFPDNLMFRPLFYDNDVVDFAQTIPPSLRWGENSLYRQVILVAVPELARIPATTTYGLPLSATHEQMARRKKRRRLLRRWRHRLNRISMGVIPPARTNHYVDYNSWLKEELLSWATSILFDPRTTSRDYWNPCAITLFWEEHLRGNRRGMRGLARKITALISLELWHRMYLDQEHKTRV